MAAINRTLPPTPVETMAKERENIPFDLRSMTYAMHGGRRNVEMKEKFMKEIERDPHFKLDDIHDLTKDQIRERTMAKFAAMVHYVTSEPIDVFTKRMELIAIADPGFWTRFGVHYGLFLGALRSGATSNQFSYAQVTTLYPNTVAQIVSHSWLEKGVLGLNGVTGCFGMTELAHGSNVAGLETTATFDERSDEFVIHTPSVSATKWWIGGAASTATHCSVFARLIINDKDHGTKTFIVPLRNPKTFALLPGISIGDLGSKMGRQGIDNGYIQFTYVRIPRQYMLMKHTQVTRDGQVREPPLQQLTYGALLQGRTAMVSDAANVAKKALTIALRYGAVRRQFKTGDNPLETQLLDYPIHQRRLIPLLSQAIALGFTALRMAAMFEHMTAKMEQLDAGADEKDTQEVLEALKETHATSAGLKAFSTWWALETIDKCRQACGGHGYSSYTGLASMYADQAVQCSWEGDNTILSLQAGRSLISAYQDAKKGKRLADGVAYLGSSSTLKAKCPSEDKIGDLAVIDKGWGCVAGNAVQRAAKSYESWAAKGKGHEEALELCSQDRFIAAKIHTVGSIFRQFRQALIDLEKAGNQGQGVLEWLHKIAELYGLWQVEEHAAFFLRSGFYSNEQIDKISDRVNELCATVRKVAVPLTDSFDYSDHLINSPLGVYNGNVYERYFEQVRKATPFTPRPPYFESLIKPLLEREALEIADPSDMELDDEIEEIRQEREEAASGKKDEEVED